MALDLARLRQGAAELAEHGVFIGTSSWKYPGWRGLLYQEDRYVWHGKFSETRFDRLCLTEYAEVFKTVCVDAAYYKFPDARHLQGLISQVPSDFKFTFKVTDDITIKNFSNLPRFGHRAGKLNTNFLNADLFTSAFLSPCEPFQNQIGLLILEFSHFYPADFARGRDFVAALDRFLGQLPKQWSYGVEIRNQNFLHPDYFAMLARHGVAHIYNSWGEMPSVTDQLAMPGSLTNPAFSGARLLLKPGRKYQQAVDLFQPYNRVKEPYEEARVAAAGLIKEILSSSTGRKLFIYVNNRLEGNALLTILAILSRLDPMP
ncbi:MAG: hypothetical protein JWR69_3025 [Pedosphaera sp.]|nr:hypothetical protein [Pedosphaera sp.]